MIAFIKGTLEHIFEQQVIIDNNGIGYTVMVSPRTISQLPPIGGELKIFTYMNVKEDFLALYGFMSLEEINIFNLLISVSGIGPKGALAIVGTISPPQIMLAIVTDDINTLSKVPGVGKKTAQRMILELKDKIKTHDTMSETFSTGNSTAVSSGGGGAKQDAIDALIALGYSRSEGVKAVMEVALQDMTAEQIIKLALKKLI